MQKMIPFLILILSISTLIFIDVPLDAWSSGASDFEHHYYMAYGEIDKFMPDAHYVQLWRTITSPFSFSQKSYALFILFFFFLVAPFVYYFFLKEKSILFFYFVTQMPFTMEVRGMFPQFALGLLFLPFVFSNNRLFKGFLLLISLCLHSWGFQLFVFAWLLQELFLVDWKNICLGCTGMGSSTIVPMIDNKLIDNVSIGDFVRFFSRTFNIFLIYPALLGLWENKQTKFLVVLCPLLFVVGSVIHMRVWQTLSMILLIGLPVGIKRFGKNVKWFYVLGVLLVVWNFYTWFFDKKFGLIGEC